MKSFELRHIIGFQETNLVGNVYFVNHLKWQGRCREMFLKTHAPGVVQQIADGLALATVRVSCDYFAELEAFDEILLRMTLGKIQQNRIGLLFDYFRVHGDDLELIARGEQEVACMQREGEGMVPVRIPDELRDALRAYEA
ncbi:MAG: acyl-CoA thioesterase [Acidobacteriota bacterium]